MVTSFKYLGIFLSVADDDWKALVRNLVKARMVWRIMSRILRREGAIPQATGFFFKAVIQ